MYYKYFNRSAGIIPGSPIILTNWPIHDRYTIGAVVFLYHVLDHPHIVLTGPAGLDTVYTGNPSHGYREKPLLSGTARSV